MIDTLFNIALCSCFSNTKETFDPKACSCPRTAKIPDVELQFFRDQLTERKIFIGGTDKFQTRTLQKREARKRADEERKRQAIDDRKSRDRSRSFLSTSLEDEDNFLGTIPEPPPSSSQT